LRESTALDANDWSICATDLPRAICCDFFTVHARVLGILDSRT